MREGRGRRSILGTSRVYYIWNWCGWRSIRECLTETDSFMCLKRPYFLHFLREECIEGLCGGAGLISGFCEEKVDLKV
jgi:hypothetical protein